MSYRKYTDLDVWKESRILVKNLYEITRTFPKEEQFGLTNQMRRCAVSVPSNIAEGCGRNHSKDSIQFFYISRGSLFELETQLYLSFDLNYIDETTLSQILDILVICRKLLSGFIKYYKTLQQ